jgi:predicted alpha/beta-hydrolase family hydrolase
MPVRRFTVGLPVGVRTRCELHEPAAPRSAAQPRAVPRSTTLLNATRRSTPRGGAAAPAKAARAKTTRPSTGATGTSGAEPGALGAQLQHLRLVLAHGAGAPMHSDFMQAFAHGLARRGLATVVFNFAYMEQGRRLPDRAPALVEQLRTVAARAMRGLPANGRLLLGGKSMGGRVATMLAAETDAPPCAGLVLLGYPLHRPGTPQELRADHFSRVGVPSLFISGTRDTLAEPALLEKAVLRLGAPAHVHWIEEGDHSLEVPRRSGRTSEQAWEEAMDEIIRFAAGVGGAARGGSKR